MTDEQRRVEQEDRDLGFGAVVAKKSRQRLLNRDGSFNVVRRGLGLRASLSLFHSLLTMSWPRFILLAMVGYLLVNGVFAIAYYLCGPEALKGVAAGSDLGRLEQSFFFSVQTISTVGYGQVVPVGLAANLLMTAESMVGLFGLALGTGLIFARFSRPHARILFSCRALIAPYRGGRAFEFRLTNRRRSQIVDLEARVVMSRLEQEGSESRRRFYDLPLERHRVSFFPLSWTIVHPIDENSPLDGVSEEDLLASDAEFMVLLTGMDETFSQMVHARTSYKAEEILWHARFRSMFQDQGSEKALAIDVSRIDEVSPVDP